MPNKGTTRHENIGVVTPTPTLPAYSAEVASGYVGRAEGEGYRHALHVIPPPSPP